MAVFVSGSDESAGKTERDRFYQAGFVAPESDWSDFFVPAWQERVLDGPPKIPYLHMTDIRSPKWRTEHGLSKTSAEDRVDEACNLIHTMGSLYPIGAHLDAGVFRDNFGSTKFVAASGGAKTFEPDYTCFLLYTVLVLSYVDTYHPEAEKVDFIVERKSDITKHIQEFHSHTAANLAALGQSSLARLVGDLIPGDKDRVPLQAADVLCWHSARSKSEAMDEPSYRRYCRIAHNAGCLIEVTKEQIAKLKIVLSV
jgi:hypothetical protein